jgi:3-oxoacyl-[acyl-carrier protein] reductase
MDLGIRGRRALVFGGSRGMGFAAARVFAAEGVAVTIAARDPERLARAAATLSEETGTPVAPVVADLSTEFGRRAALDACPQPDILVNNADGPPPGDFRQWSRDDWIRAADSVMLGPIAMIRLVLDGMIARGFGRIVNIGSRSVKSPQVDHELSNAARLGLVGFVAGIAREAVRHGVTVNTILPGIFATDAQRHHVAALARHTGRAFEDIWAERARTNPAGRFGDPAEFGALCAWLCSARSGFITGQGILIDGGAYPGTY